MSSPTLTKSDTRSKTPASVAVATKKPIVQTSLKIGQPGDQYEKEADQVADQIVQKKDIRSADPSASLISANSSLPVQRITPIQRKEDAGFTKDQIQPSENMLKAPPGPEKVQRQEEEKLQKQSIADSNFVSGDTEQEIDQSRGSGVAMASGTLNEMNGAFGADFSGVRIHTDGKATQLSEKLQAKAFTTGNNIYFNHGQYQPGTHDGKRLLAHELTHTIQQGNQQHIQREEKPKKNDSQAIFDFLKAVDDKLKQQIEQEYDVWKRQNKGVDPLEAHKAHVRIAKEKSAQYRAMMTDDYIKSMGLDPVRVRAFVKDLPTNMKAQADQAAQALRERKGYPKGYSAKYTELQTLIKKKIEVLERKVDSTKEASEKDLYHVQLQELLASQYYFGKEDTKKYCGSYQNPIAFIEGIIKRISTYPLPYDQASYLKTKHDLEESTKEIRRYAGDISEQLYDCLKDNLPFNLARIQSVFSGHGGSGTGTGNKPKTIEGDDQELPDPQLNPDKIKEEEKDQALEEFLVRLKKASSSVNKSSPAYIKLVKELAKMSAEERERFLEYIKNQQTKSEDEKREQSGVLEELEKYRKLSDLEKKILDTNRKLREDSTNKDGGDIMVDLGELTPETTPKGQTAQEVLKEMSKADSVLNRIKKQAGVKGSALSIDPGWSPFLTELSVFYGLLAGAGKRSAAIKDLSKELMENLRALRDTINKEILKSAALLLLTSGGGPLAQAGALGLRFKKIKKLIETGQKVVDVKDKIVNFYQAVTDPKLRNALATIDQKVKKVEEMEKKLSAYDSLDDLALEENLFQMEEQLRAQLITLVADKGDTLMQYLYIPEEKGSNPEDFIQELMKILYDLPKGLNSFKAMHKNYKALTGKDSASKDEIAVLSLLAVDTGVYLYPFVGMLTQVANNALEGLNSREFFDAFGRKKGRNRASKKYKKPPKDDKQRKKDTKEKFAKLDRSKYIYNDKTLENQYLKKYEQRFEKYLNKPENALFKGYWTPGYFKYVARNYYKEIKREVRGDTVTAKDKKSKRSVKAPAPMFRLTNWKLKGNQFAFKLKVNPDVDVESLTNHTLEYKTFEKAGGIPYTFAAMGSTKNKRIRKKELKKWLTENGYQFTYESDDKGNPIKTEANLHIRRGVKESEYLHLDNGVIKHNLHTDANKAYKNFFGKKINSSSDLPEGYVLKLSPTPLEPTRRTVSRKRGLPSHMKPLHWDGGVLTKEAKTKTPETVKKLGTHNVVAKDYNYLNAINNMFDIRPGQPEVPKSQFNMQKKDTVAKWKHYIENHKDSNGKKRPEKVEVNLGYVINARANGDKLSSYKLPEMKKNDDNGHLVARRFGAVEFFNNLVPMNRDKNQKGDWAKMEHEIAQKFIGQEPITGNYVHADIEITYPSNDTRRPSNFKVEWEEKTSTNTTQAAIPSTRGGNRKVRGSLNMSN